MSVEATGQDDDQTLNLRLQLQDPAALSRLLELYGPIAKGYVKKRYGDILSETDIEDVLFEAAGRAWKYGESFNPAKSLKSWFLTIVQRQAIDMLNDKIAREEVQFDIDFHNRPETTDGPISPKSLERIEDLKRCIEKLEGNQKAIIRADLKSDDVADAGFLAKKLGTNKNSIYVSRNKARENLRKCVTDYEVQRRSKGAKK